MSLLDLIKTTEAKLEHESKSLLTDNDFVNGIKLLQDLCDATGVSFYLLGGSVASSVIKKYNPETTFTDFDLYFKSESDLYKVLDKYDKFGDIHKYETKNAITIGNIQFIRKEFGTYIEHFNNFDLNVSKIGLEFKPFKPKSYTR